MAAPLPTAVTVMEAVKEGAASVNTGVPHQRILGIHTAKNVQREHQLSIGN